ncbi:THAP domain-containing protein 1-like [Vanessa tameamea]|uniref:THAP domain-containing protein 1-like n=1 Tax=Vanessa tameamea TaxID=334116 RepID=A0A8B8HFI8_VANTA
MTYCALKGCPNSSHDTQEHQNITFHVFPTDPIIAGRWVEQIRLNHKEEYWQPNKYTNVCSIHFDESQTYTTNGGLCKLRQTAIPTKRLYIVCKEENQDSDPHEPDKVQDFICKEERLDIDDQYDPHEPDKLLDAWSKEDDEKSYFRICTPSSPQKIIKSGLLCNEANGDNVTLTSAHQKTKKCMCNVVHTSKKLMPTDSDTEFECIFDSERNDKLRRKLEKKIKIHAKQSLQIKNLQQKVRRLIKKNSTLQNKLDKLTQGNEKKKVNKNKVKKENK